MSAPVSFLKAVETDLAFLSQECRRILPSVTAAADSVAIDLRHASAALRNVVPTGHGDPSNVAAFAARHNLTPTTSILSIDEHASLLSQLLQPFILACNYSAAPKKALTCSLSAIQKFVTADAIPQTEYGNIVRVLELQADNAEEEVRLKVLQLLPLLLSQPSHYPEGRMVSSLLSMAFGFLRDKAGFLKHAASATIQQTTALMFERADKEVISARPSAAAALITIRPDSTSMTAACRLLLQDLIMVAGGLPPQWIRRAAPVPRVLAADLIDYVAREHSLLFYSVAEFQSLVQTLLVPLLLRQLPTQSSFPLFLRFARIARSTLCHLHTASPAACRALVSLLVRMVYAAARGEDFGANTARAIDRFGSAGIRILAEAHKKLGQQTGEEAPVHTNVTFDGADGNLMQAVATIPLGPLPLWKCVILLEALHSVTLRPAVVCSLFVTFDEKIEDADAPHKRDFQHLFEGVVLLLKRLMNNALNPDSATKDADFGIKSRRDTRASESERSSSIDASGTTLGDDQVDEFFFTIEDVEHAAQSHGKRLLANLALPDADAHVFTSSAGGIQPALALASSASHGSAPSGLLGFVGSVAGASLSLVTAAAARITDKDAVLDATSSDTVPPPIDLEPASIVLSCIEIVVNVAAAVAIGADVGTDGGRASNVSIVHAHFAAGSLKDASAKVFKPLLSAEKGEEVASTTSSKAETAAASKDTTTEHSTTPSKCTTSDYPPITSLANMAEKLWKLVMDGLSAVLTTIQNAPLCSYCLKAYQSFTYACGILQLELPRDALLVNLCRNALPRWIPTPGASNIALSLLGAEARALPSDAKTQLSAVNILVLKTLFNIAHCLGGVLGQSWIVLIDTFEQFDKLVESDKLASFARKRRVLDAGSSNNNLLQMLRAADRSTAGGMPTPGKLPELPKTSYDETDERVADTPDDELAVLGVALSTLFHSSVYLGDKALKDLINALSDLTITSFADSATAELAETPLSQLDYRDTSQRSVAEEDVTSSGRPKSSRAVRRQANQATDVFSVEAMAAEDARELIAGSSATNDAPEVVPESPSVVVLPKPRNNPETPVGGLPSSKSIKPPFALTRLMETCMFNTWRLPVFWESINALLRVLARSRSSSVRQYGLNSSADIAIAYMLQLSKPPATADNNTHSGSDNHSLPISQAELLSPLFDYWRNPHSDTRVETLKCLRRIVEEAGAVMSSSGTHSGWAAVLGVLHAVAALSLGVNVFGKPCSSSDIPGDGTPCSVHAFAPFIPTQLFDAPDNRSAHLGGPAVQQVVAEAFSVLELIGDEYLDKIPASGLLYVIWLYALFARQRFAMNAAITTVSQAWKLLDLLFSNQPSHTSHISETERSAIWTAAYTMLVDLIRGDDEVRFPYSCNASPAWRENTVIAPSPRPEVRNAAVEAIFTSLITHSASLSSDLWKTLICEHLLPMIYRLTIITQVNLAEDVRIEGETIGKRRGDAVSKDIRMTVHHSRDTVGKQWNETRVLAYQGFVKAIVACFRWLQCLDWFPDVWTEILAVIERSIVGNQAKDQTKEDSKDVENMQTLLEPPDVSVPAVACLQRLALLACVPAGPARPPDDAERYSFNMRVIDGALVRVHSESDEQGGGYTVAEGTTEAHQVAPELRERLWEDVRSVLSAVCTCTAVAADAQETVSSALVSLLFSLLTTSVHSQQDVCCKGQPSSMLDMPARFGELLELTWQLFDRRRKVRWSECFTIVNKAAVMADLPALPSSPTKPTTAPLTEDMTAPKFDVVTSLERSLIKELEGVFHGMLVLPARFSTTSSDRTFRDNYDARWRSLVEFACRVALIQESLYAQPFLQQSSSFSSPQVAIPVSAFSLQCIKLLLRLLSTSGRLDTTSINGVSDARFEFAQQAALGATQSSCNVVASSVSTALLSHRRVTDAAVTELEKYERHTTATPAAITPSSSSLDSNAGATPLDLHALCELMGFENGAHRQPRSSGSPRDLRGNSALVYPVKVWGFGLGGAYGLRGEGGLVVADVSKSKKQVQRNQQFTNALVECLVRSVGDVTHAAAAVDGRTAHDADVLPSLMTTLKALIGAPQNVALNTASASNRTPGTVSRSLNPSNNAANGAEALRKALNAAIEGASGCQGAARSARLSTLLTSKSVDTLAWHKWESDAAAADALYFPESASDEPMKALLSLLRSCMGPTASCSDAAAAAFIHGKELYTLAECMGWRDAKETSRSHQQDAEVFLLQAVCVCVQRSLLSLDFTPQFTTALTELLHIMNATAAALAFNPYEEDVAVPTIAPSKDALITTAAAATTTTTITSPRSVDLVSFRRIRSLGRMSLQLAVQLCGVTCPASASEEAKTKFDCVTNTFKRLVMTRSTDLLAVIPFVDTALHQMRAHGKTKRLTISTTTMLDVLCATRAAISAIQHEAADVKPHVRALYSVMCACVMSAEPMVRLAVQNMLRLLPAHW